MLSSERTLTSTMKVVFVFLIALSVTFAQSSSEEPAPPDARSNKLACSMEADIHFILDSSTTIREGNFELAKTFVQKIVSAMNISQDLTRISLNRYTSWVDSRFFFNTYFDKEGVLQAIHDTPYYGRGTRTGQAIKVTHDHHLTKYSGWRGNEIPTIVIIITDGESQDPEAVKAQIKYLHAKATRVIAIGIGAVNKDEINLMATQPISENAFFLTAFSDLDAELASITNLVCKTEGDENECSTNNGNCDSICINTAQGYYCECHEGYELVGKHQCQDIDECVTDNGGCSHDCVNSDGSYICACGEGFILAHDKRSCGVDSCFNGHECSHICNNGNNEDYFCSCRPGFRLSNDSVSCLDINECNFNNGGCEHSCTNTEGGHQCSCLDGMRLRSDGKTCGAVCYTCQNVLSNEECMNETICPPNENSCFTETRIIDGNTLISKSCKQAEACINNFIQNPRDAWEPSQCSSNNGSVCRCCCHDSLCNEQGSCDGTSDLDIKCQPLEYDTSLPNTTVSCSGNKVGDACQVKCPTGFAPINGNTHIECRHSPRSLSADWQGSVSQCVDINECANNNGGCSHNCINFDGGYECSCPANQVTCSEQKFDLFFIIDATKSVGSARFDKLKDFILQQVSDFTIGPDNVQVGVMTYDKYPKKQIDFNEATSFMSLAELIDAIEFGEPPVGTYTAAAMEFAVDTRFGDAQGRRANAPLVVQVITDGRSHDARNLKSAGQRLNHVADEVFAVGILKDTPNEHEFLAITNDNMANYRILSTFKDLASFNELNLCPFSTGAFSLSEDMHTCDVNECNLNNGGCSDICVNEIGSYTCECLDDNNVIADDGKTCVPNNCIDNDGGCDIGCLSKLTGTTCYCDEETQLFDGNKCVDFDECKHGHNDCSFDCENLTPGFKCLCPEGQTLDTDMITCVEDTCHDQQFPFICDHNCINIPNSDYTCTCNDGYILEADGHNCTEINECDINNGGCEFECVNTDGGHECRCPEGFVLRNDGKTCALTCYVCDGVESLEECQDIQECPYGADACFATIRTRQNVTSITKGCQQSLACLNNMIQNPRAMGEGPSQCNTEGDHSKCECCCFESDCNADVCPYETSLPGCPVFDKEDAVFYGLQSNGMVLPGGRAVVQCKEGYEPVQTFAATHDSVNCVYNFENNTSAWDGVANDLDICADIDECLDDWVCHPSTVCVNTPGSFECVCPPDHDDYVIMNGTICERDECSDIDQGGCSHNCTNTIGGYSCFCPSDLSLLDDGLTCNFDECRENNGGCEELCINTLSGNECDCYSEGFQIDDDGVSCKDIDECAIANGNCQYFCNNFDGDYECLCPEGMLLNDDQQTCRDDPCYINNGNCSQVCEVNGDEALCKCLSGYELALNGACIDIDECNINNGSCSHNCTNTEGGFQCDCPAGMALHVDGLTCGHACYQCDGAETNEECNQNGLQVCPVGADACENEVRVHNGHKQIFKRCKQSHACENNFLQNPRVAWLPSQCNGNEENDVCRCCCEGHMCNVAERPCAQEQECHLQEADVLVVLDSSSSVKYSNFQKMKSFAKSLFATFELGEGLVHTALLRYNKIQDIRFTLADSNSREEVMDAVDVTPYDGSGTRTGEAILFSIDNLLSAEAGRRPGVPGLVVVVTDGKSQDDVANPSEALRSLGMTTIAVGIGNVDHDEILDIAGSAEKAFITESFDELITTVLDEVTAAACKDEDECLVSNGGCSHNCHNSPGSYHCSCPDDLVLDIDMQTCIIDDGRSLGTNQCRIRNGGCSHGCVPTLSGYNCTCPTGYQLDSNDEKQCHDINECADSPCSHDCINTEGHFFCLCPPSHSLSQDEITCVQRPGDLDCLVGYSALAHSCLQFFDAPTSYETAQSVCKSDGASLINVSDFGVRSFVSSYFTKTSTWWSDTEPSVRAEGNCSYVTDKGISQDLCSKELSFICEIQRSSGLVVFSRNWPNGAQGSLHFPTGSKDVIVRFPSAVTKVVAWHCSAQPVPQSGGRDYKFTQNFIQMKSSTNGQCEFTVDMKQRFADYDVVVLTE